MQFTMQRAMIDEAAEKDERRKLPINNPSLDAPKAPETRKSRESDTNSDVRGGAGSDIAIQMD